MIDIPTEQLAVRHDMADLELRHLTVDPRAQRQLRQPKVDKIAGAFDPEALGIIVCSWRDIDKNLINVVDGQHRVAACRQVGYTGTLRSLVYYGLTLQGEAALFRKLNAGDKPSHADLFITRCTEGDKVAIGAVQILTDYGWVIQPAGNVNGSFSATAALERAYLLSPPACSRAVRLLTNGLGHAKDTLQGTLLHGMTMVTHRYGDELDESVMVRALKNVPGGADAIIADGRARHRLMGGSVPESMAYGLVKEYNKHVRGSNKLTPWS